MLNRKRNRSSSSPVLSRRVFAALCLAAAALLLAALYFPFRFGGWTEVDNGWSGYRPGSGLISLKGVPDLYEAPCANPGTVTAFSYKASLLDHPEITEVRTLYVYLPYGYGTTVDGKSCDVLYLLHGSKNDASSWLADNPVTKNVVDNLIAFGDIPPLLIVTPDLFEPESFGFGSEADRAQFSFELRKQMIPAVESAFPCAPAVNPDQARSHRMLAGLSRGSQMVFEAGLADGLDLFSRFGTFSGMLTDPSGIVEGMERDSFRELPIDGLYAFNGFFDYTFYEHGFRMTLLDGMTDRITKGGNYEFYLIQKGEHTWPSWEAALFNFLLLACPPGGE